MFFSFILSNAATLKSKWTFILFDHELNILFIAYHKY